MESQKLTSKERYEKSIKEGKCVKCKEMSINGQTMCQYHIEYCKKSYEKVDKAELNKKANARRKSLKQEVYSRYGDRCLCCGESEEQFLTIDHTDGNGAEHRKTLSKSSSSILYWLKRNNYPDNFRILCYNCNIAIAYLGNCPHGNLPPQATNHPANPYKKKETE